MKKKIFAVCDTETDYAKRFCEYVTGKNAYPFEAAAFTSAQKLKEFCKSRDVEVVLISESIYDMSLQEIVKGEVLVLKEEEGERTAGSGIYKYQSCEKIMQEVMRCCAGKGLQADSFFGTKRKNNLQIIGLYTPIHRCMQTSFAITLGEILAKEHSVLYLNFESFSGLEKQLNREFMTDMSDLIYYVTNAREALVYKLKGMTEKLQNLDYIPPVFSYMDLARITQEQWFLLLEEIERLTDYEYIILDLSENVQGLFEILRSCNKVFTLFREDSAALAKMYQYERLLLRADYEDVLEKSKKYKLPFLKNISFDPLKLTHGELADYMKRIIKEELYGG